MFKKKFSQDYYDAVDILVRGQYYDGYICIIFDIGETLCTVDYEKAEDLVRDLKLGDFDYNELINSDYMIIEFDKYVDMEEYLFNIEHLNVFAKFYKLGDLFEELPEEK